MKAKNKNEQLRIGYLTGLRCGSCGCCLYANLSGVSWCQNCGEKYSTILTLHERSFIPVPEVLEISMAARELGERFDDDLCREIAHLEWVNRGGNPDWRIKIPEGVRRIWSHLSGEQKVVAYLLASETAWGGSGGSCQR